MPRNKFSNICGALVNPAALFGEHLIFREKGTCLNKTGAWKNKTMIGKQQFAWPGPPRFIFLICL